MSYNALCFFAFNTLFMPLFAFIFASIFAFSARKKFVGIICFVCILVSAISAIALLLDIAKFGAVEIHLAKFISAGNLDISHGFILDELSITMIAMVGFVSTIVQIYSIWYMSEDEKFNRFFAFLSLFVFAMIILVASDNFIGLFIGWEGVGLCSWILIGFWHENSSFSYAANEAFIMNRIADFAMIVGIFLIFREFGSLNYANVLQNANLAHNEMIFFIAMLLFIGAMGKSAQFPFHTWLADAMAGPTPVSALIHAATMVTAGVYLVIRTNEIFAISLEMSKFIAILGTFVAIFGASLALVCNDLKKIIAYSTLSQLGYMFVAVGFGAYWIGFFHLLTHAFFKSLLFLCAGNIMHAMKNDTDISHMGALYKTMKFSAILMIIASVALCGIYPFAGFFSKDKILEVAFGSVNFAIWICLLIGALMSAFYSFRLIMIVFFDTKKHLFDTHEAPKFVISAMILLAFMSIIGGVFGEFIEEMMINFGCVYEIKIAKNVEIWLILLTLILISSTILLTIWLYKRQILKDKFNSNFLYKILLNQYFIPKFYNFYVVGAYKKICQMCAKFDECVIDFSVDLIAKICYFGGERAFALQDRNLSFMLGLMAFGLVMLLIIAI